MSNITSAGTINSHPDASVSTEANPPLISGSSANLDFLRTFAVTLVVVRHVLGAFQIRDTPWLHLQALGIFGVVLFFVHTSLVLMFSMERQQKRTGSKHFYTTFLVRRIFRIYPLSVFVVLLMALGSALWPAMTAPPDPLTGHLGPKGVFANLLLIQDFLHTPTSIGPLWSLPLEMQMYLLLPVLFLSAPRLGVSGLLGLWFGAVILAIVQWKHPFPPGLFEYMPCFLPGVLCYLLSRQKPTLPFWMFPVLLVSLFVAYETVYGRFHHGQAFLGMPACLILGFLLPRFRDMPGKFSRRLCETVARYSYGIYLTHAIFVWLAFTHLRPAPLAVQWGIFVAGLVVGPVLVYHVIEEPMIKYGNRLVGYLHKSRLTP